VVVVAESRALAEDAVSRVLVEWEPLTAVTDPETALEPDTPVIHPELGDNLVFETRLSAGDVDRAFAEADAVYADTFTIGRHTGVPLEPRVIIADFDPSERRLTELAALMREGRYHLGLATDGDADRFGVLDADGTYVTANEVLALVVNYLIDTRGAKGGVARSVATSHLVDAVARHHGREVYETGVGFKYIGRLIADGKLVAGGEEAQGLTIGGHVPDKDGILACLLLTEMVARTGKPLRRQLEELTALVGPRHYRRVDRPLAPSEATALAARLKGLSTVGGLPIARRAEVEGILKFYFGDGSWMIVRPSGTEPVVRVYAEAASAERVDELLAAGCALLTTPGA